MFGPGQDSSAIGQLTLNAVAVVLAAVPLAGVDPEVSTARTWMSQLLPSVEVVTVADVATAGVTSVQPPVDGQDAEAAFCRVWYFDAVPVAGADQERSTCPAVHALVAVRDWGADGAVWAWDSVTSRALASAISRSAATERAARRARRFGGGVHYRRG